MSSAERKEGVFPFISVSELRKRYIFNSIKESLGWSIFFIFSLYIFYHFFSAYFSQLNWFFIVAFFLSLLALFSLNLGELVSGIPLRYFPSEKLGKYNSRELNDLLLELCNKFAVTSPPNIYIEDSVRANAMVVRSELFYFIPLFNKITISSYLLNTLEKDELKAVLAHELSHVAKYPSFQTKFFVLKIILLSIWSSIILFFFYSKLGLIAAIVIFFTGLIFSIVSFVLLPFIFFGRSDDQEIESLCDYEGARLYGILAMINGLLKVGAREEIFYYLYSQFSPRYDKLYFDDDSDEEEEPKEQKNREMFRKNKEALSYAEELLEERLPHTFISLEDAKPIIEKVVKQAIKEKGGRRFRHRIKGVLRWQKFDNKIKNLKIDPVEYDEFIEVLKKYSQQPLFYSSDEFNPEEERKFDHPSLKNRILFLNYNFELPDSNLKLKI